MEDAPVCVLDTNVLINLALPVVDQRSIAPSGEDPFKTVLSEYEVHIPRVVLGEVTEIAGGDDLLGTAADLVLLGASHLVIHDTTGESVPADNFGLDPGESHAIALANTLQPDLFVTDEFNSANLQLIHLAIFDRNIVFTTPHVLCELASHGILHPQYVKHLLGYYSETRHWDRAYLDYLRDYFFD